MSPATDDGISPERVRALLVEDNPGDVRLIREMVREDAGRPVDLCTCGDLTSAKDRLARESFDVVLCDLGLPDSSGVETLTHILAAAGHTPVLVLTGDDDTQRARRCLAEGAQDYVCKSHIGGDLNAIIYNARERHRLRAELEDAHRGMRNLLADSDDGVVVLDRGNRVLFANRAANAMFEGKLEVGESFGAPITGDTATTIEIASRDGAARHVELRIRPTRWYDEQTSVVNLRDVTSRIDDQQRIEHLNRVLKAIRHVNQLIVVEHEPAVLIDKVCRSLIETRGYNGAWIILGDGEGEVNAFADAGWGREFEPLATQLECAGWPTCASPALAEDECYVVQSPSQTCSGCPLSSHNGDSLAVVTALRHEEAVYGLLGVSFPAKMVVDRDERDLLLEVAGDIAFALHKIELEGAKAESESRLAAAIQGGGVGLWEWNLVTNRIAFSAEWKAQIGYAPDDVADAYEEWERRVHPDDFPAVVDRIERSVADPDHPYEAEFRLRHKDGTYRWILARALVERSADSTPMWMYGSHIDVTDLRQQQEELRKNRDLLRTIADNYPNSYVSIIERDLTVGMSAGQAFEQRGLDPQDFIGSSIDQVFKQQADEIREAYLKTFAGEEQSFELTIDGEHQHYRTVPIRSQDGDVTQILVVAENITERREMQAQLAQADRLSSMGMLAAGVAHEINNPLSYVLYNLESLGEDLPQLLDALRRLQWPVADRLGADALDELAGPDAEVLNPVMLDDMRSRLKDALKGAHRIRDVSRGLGTFSRVEKDRLVPVNLEHVIEVALNMASNEIKYRARLVRDYGRDLPPVLGSEGRLGQVFLNLVINAVHAIDEGDIDNNEIRVTTRADGDVVIAEVRDTGSGIPHENLGRLFEPFFTTKEAGVGSGLGLAISRDIVEGYGGSIEVESEVGEGSCFTIRLPFRTRVAPSPEDSSNEEAADTVRGRILIVDDEDLVRAMMARMLREHDTVQAANGVEAKRILEQDQRFDAILCDMMMPDVSGMDLHRWLAAEHPALARRLVFVTGGAFTPKAREYLSTVDNVQLEKPCDMATLQKTVAEAIASRQESG